MRLWDIFTIDFVYSHNTKILKLKSYTAKFSDSYPYTYSFDHNNGWFTLSSDNLQGALNRSFCLACNFITQKYSRNLILGPETCLKWNVEKEKKKVQ